VKTMAEVIQSHHMSHSDWDENQFAILCHCGMEVVGEDDGEESYQQEEALYAGHLADALTAAGFGPVKAAQAEAWDEGMDWANALQSGTDKSDNPKRAATIEPTQ
jgi:hypothetical protein